MIEFAFDVEHIRSSANLTADGLLCLLLPQVDWGDDDDVQVASITISEAVKEEQAASELRRTLSS